MSEKKVAIIGSADSGYDILLEQMDRVLKQNMELVSVSGDYQTGYEYQMGKHAFVQVKPQVYITDKDFDKKFQQDHQLWSGIILVLNGTAFDTEAEDSDEFIYKTSRVLQESGQLDVLETFARADKNWKVPPVLLVAVNEKKEIIYEEAFRHVIKYKFPLFFDDTFPKRTTVSITKADIWGKADLRDLPISNGAEVSAFFMSFSGIIAETYEKRVQWERLLYEYQQIQGIHFKSKAQKLRLEELEELQEPLHTHAYYLKKGQEVLMKHLKEDAVAFENRRFTSNRSFMYAMAAYYNFYEWEFSSVKQDHWNDMNIDLGID